MTGASTGSALEHRHDASRQPAGLRRRCDQALDAVIVVMATWTLVYHLCFLLKLDSTIALALAAVVLAVALVLVLRRPATDAPLDPSTGGSAIGPGPVALARAHPRLLGTTVGAAAVASVAMATSLPWLLVWVPWLLAAVSGTVLAQQALLDHRAEPPVEYRPERPERPEQKGRWEARAVLALGLALAVLSLVVLRPNPDDLFYVNLSQWVAAHGSFPHRDTIYADLAYPLSNWPPLASYDAGVGALAHPLGVHAATVAYIGVPPVAALLSVLAMWRLLRAWQVRHVVIALAAAVVFMMFDGTSSYGTPGNLWVTRLWQGKVILLCVVVPWLLVAALHYVRSPSRRGIGWLATGGVAAVACSTTAVFLVPVVALAAAAPLVRRAPRQAAALFGAMAGYPLVMAVVTKAVGGRSADDFGSRRQFRFDPSWFGHEVFLDGAVALVGVAAVLLGCLLVPHPAARVTTAAAAALTGITFIPGITHLGYDTVGLGPTLWRLTWSLSVAALVGAGASYAATVLRRRVAVGAAVLSVALLAVLGHPILSLDTTTTFAVPLHWQRNDSSRQATAWLLGHTDPGDRVLAPDGLGITVAVTTTSVKTVTPRDYYMYYLRDVTDFRYQQRLLLTDFVNQEPGWQPDHVAPALAALDVKAVCLYRLDLVGAQILLDADFRRGFTSPTYQCLVPALAEHG